MIFVGIDYSITSPALCVFTGEPDKFSLKDCVLYSLCDHRIDDVHPFYFRTHQESYFHQTHRYMQIAEWALDHIPSRTELVGIEDYSMGSKGKVFNIAENCGLLKFSLFDKGLLFDTVAPTVVKKFATGKGNAVKEKMVEQFQADTGLDLKKMLQPTRKLGSPTTDLVDAYYICKYFVDKHNSSMLQSKA